MPNITTVQPLVSIIMPTHNRAELVTKSIESALNQSYKNFEFIIVNDASTDETAEILRSYADKDKRIRVLTNEVNLRIQKSLNRGLAEANGEYIARIDDDDVWIDSKKLEKQVTFLETHSDYVLVGTGNIAVFQAKGIRMKSLKPETDEQIRANMLFGCPFLHPAIVMRAAALQKVGGWYDEQLTDAEDYDLWLRLGKVGKLYNLPEYSIESLVGATNRAHLKRKEVLTFTLVLIKKYQHDYPGFYRAYVKNYLLYLDAAHPWLRKVLFPLFWLRRKIINFFNRRTISKTV